MHNRAGILAVLAISLGLTTSCAVKAPPDDIVSPERAMIIGYVEAEYPIDAIDFHEYGVTYVPPFTVPPRVLVYKDGFFMAENVKPGKYFISGFYSDRKLYTTVNSAQTAYQNIVIIKPGAVQYVGSHRIEVYKRRLLTRGEFEVKQIQRPGERQALRHFYHVTEGTGWQKKIARRLQELRQ
ncbi:MAG: hypothetical protein OEZ39_14350 [Gammaproteobacteria bacterium]|nr:hypothetical protein [Gammaproteobacteria bacterium]